VNLRRLKLVKLWFINSGGTIRNCFVDGESLQ